MTISALAQPPVARGSLAAFWVLSAIEARRMVRHPALWLGLTVTAGFVGHMFTHPSAWWGNRYAELLVGYQPLLLGISIAAVATFGRELTPVAVDAPLDAPIRSLARLVAGLVPVAMVTVCTVAGAFWLRARGGLELGDGPGRTLHAYYSLPEVIQPVALACFAVAVAAAAVHLVRRRLVVVVALSIMWYLAVINYWLFNGEVLRYVALVQIQPVTVYAGPAHRNPSTFPSDWLLQRPGEHWGRLVVSQSMAAWHDVYLACLTAVAVAIAVSGRWRAPVAFVGVAVAVAATLAQRLVAP